ncbi:hypothetical protein BJ165DRAFT_614010 [Panaeolus papilionaceus]|nr:hypothetical protein BJ165DRAFT_614010 [Panaeolus papilionaceus]
MDSTTTPVGPVLSTSPMSTTPTSATPPPTTTTTTHNLTPQVAEEDADAESITVLAPGQEHAHPETQHEHLHRHGQSLPSPHVHLPLHASMTMPVPQPYQHPHQHHYSQQDDDRAPTPTPVVNGGGHTGTGIGVGNGTGSRKTKMGKGKRGSVDEDSINFKEYVSQGKGLESHASVNRDGRISLVFDLKEGDAGDDRASIRTLARDLDQVSLRDLDLERASLRGVGQGRDNDTWSYRDEEEGDVEEFGVDKDDWACPGLSIVIMIVGSRGDVQPYVALGQKLVLDGHRVRIATHDTFAGFVKDAGLEFYSIGGNPQDLMSYMVKNPGLIPGIESLTNGDIKRKRKMLAEMIDGCWRSCFSPDASTGRAFVADAIISNPPAFAHIHCAEALGVPLLLSFTMPWSPTASFAHPLVNITTSNAGFGLSNYLSYAAAELLTWQGVGDIINTFRTTILDLEPLSITTGPGFVDRVRVPWTYCMSPALVRKPGDWKGHIDVVGFYFLDLASKYEPPEELVRFLEAGEAPVYIGFGSVVVDNPAAMTKMIFEATQQAGVRALVSAGWGGLGNTTIPPHIHILGNVPHDWLFANDRVSAVVHHGGAGTTAIGLAMGRPTVVVPFFGDQGFWGNMIHKSGAGPRPIPHRDLTVKRLREAIKFAMLPTTKEAAARLAQSIHDEDGVRRGVESFYKHLPLLNMRCDLEPTKLAVWWSAEHYLKLSAFAAQVLIDSGLIKGRSLVLHRPKEYSASDASTISSTDEPHGLFWSVTHPTGLTEVFQGKPKRERSVSPNPSHGLFNALASLHEGFHDPLSPTQIPKCLDPTSDDGSSPESSDDEKEEAPTPRSGKSKGKSQTTVTTTATTTTVIQPVPRRAKHRHSSSLTDTLFNALVDSAECASENILGMARQGSTLLNNVNTIITTKKSSQSEKDKKRSSTFSRWKAVQASTGRPQEREIRAVRIAYGKEAAKQSTKAQRAHVIKRFHEEVTQTSARRKRYAESIKQAMMGGAGAGGGELRVEQDEPQDVVLSVPMTTSPLGSPIHEGHPMDTVPLPNSATFSSGSDPSSRTPSFPVPTFGPVPMQPSASMMSTHPLSPFVTQPLNGEDDGAVFVRELEMALKLSLEEVGPSQV